MPKWSDSAQQTLNTLNVPEMFLSPREMIAKNVNKLHSILWDAIKDDTSWKWMKDEKNFMNTRYFGKMLDNEYICRFIEDNDDNRVSYMPSREVMWWYVLNNAYFESNLEYIYGAFRDNEVKNNPHLMTDLITISLMSDQDMIMGIRKSVGWWCWSDIYLKSLNFKREVPLEKMIKVKNRKKKEKVLVGVDLCFIVNRKKIVLSNNIYTRHSLRSTVTNHAIKLNSNSTLQEIKKIDRPWISLDFTHVSENIKNNIKYLHGGLIDERRWNSCYAQLVYVWGTLNIDFSKIKMNSLRFVWGHNLMAYAKNIELISLVIIWWHNDMPRADSISLISLEYIWKINMMHMVKKLLVNQSISVRENYVPKVFENRFIKPPK